MLSTPHLETHGLCFSRRINGFSRCFETARLSQTLLVGRIGASSHHHRIAIRISSRNSLCLFRGPRQDSPDLSRPGDAFVPWSQARLRSKRRRHCCPSGPDDPGLLFGYLSGAFGRASLLMWLDSLSNCKGFEGATATGYEKSVKVVCELFSFDASVASSTSPRLDFSLFACACRDRQICQLCFLPWARGGQAQRASRWRTLTLQGTACSRRRLTSANLTRRPCMEQMPWHTSR